MKKSGKWERKIVAGGDYENLVVSPEGRMYNFGSEEDDAIFVAAAAEAFRAAGIPTPALESGAVAELIEAFKVLHSMVLMPQHHRPGTSPDTCGSCAILAKLKPEEPNASE